MKKIISMLLVLVMAISCTLVLTSCSEPELDFNVAKTNLEAAGYTVSIKEVDSFNTVKRLEAEKEDLHLEMYEYKDTGSAKLALEDYEIQIQQGIDNIELMIESLEHILDAYSDTMKSGMIDRYNDQLKEYRAELEVAESISCGRSGNIVWMGSKAAVEASKG